MVSISFFVLLLATYCYSVPIDPRFDSTKPDHELTTGKTIVDRDDKINMHLMTDEESTGLPAIHKQRSFMDDEKVNSTTIDSSEHHHDHMSRSFMDGEKENSTTIDSSERHDHMSRSFMDVEKENSTTIDSSEHRDHMSRSFMDGEKENATTVDSSEHRDHMSRSLDDDSFSTSTIKSNWESPSSAETNVHDNLNKFFLTTMESNTHFEKKAIMPVKEDSSEETSTVSKRSFPERDMETATDEHTSDFSTTTLKNKRIDESRENTKEHTSSAESHENTKEHTSSVDSFGKMTGLLKDKRSEENLEKPEDHSREESTTRSSDKTTDLLKDKRSEEKLEKPEDHSREESVIRPSDKTIEITKTEMILPIKVTETKITGEKPRVIEKEKSRN
jgi:hypothetical protein